MYKIVYSIYLAFFLILIKNNKPMKTNAACNYNQVLLYITIK